MTMNSDQTSTRTILCIRCNASIEETNIQPVPVHAFRSDYIPAESEIAHTRALIEKEAKLLKEYDKEVTWHRKTVERLEGDRKALKERLEKRRTSISGLRRLPVEVMDEIFSLACQTIRVGESEQWGPRNRYPFDIRHDEPIRAIAHDLSLTCASWRRIITSRPRLWSTISFDIYHRSRETDIRPLLRTYLQYSSTAPLQISIWDARRKLGSKFRSVVTYYGGLDTKSVAAYRMILQHMPRCAKLELKVNWEALTPYVTGISDIAFPQLHSLSHAVNVDSDRNAQSAWFWKSIRMAPNLAYVHEGTSDPSHVDDLPFNHQTLTTLHLGGVDGFSRLLHTLVNNSKLETFSLRALYPTWHWVDRPDQPQSLPFLRNLKVYCGYPLEQWLYFFGFITMPALESLWIGGSEVAALEGLLYHESPVSFKISSMLHRYGSSLRSLTLQFDPVSYPEAEMTNLVENLPNLTQFRFRTFASDAGCISPCITHLLSSLELAQLTRSHQWHVLAPKLEVLVIQEFRHGVWPSKKEELVNRVLNMAASRSKSSLLTSGHLYSSPVVPLSGVYVWLKKYEREVDFDMYDSDTSNSGHDDLGDVITGPFLLDSQVARIVALETEGTICRVEEKVLRWHEDMSSGGESTF